MTNNATPKVKVYSHPDRKQAETYKPYVPQYKIEGIEPREYHGAVAPGMQMARPTAVNPREAKKPSLRQPYVETSTTSPLGRGKGPVPNVGNNMEHTWAGVDSEIVDDLSEQTVSSDLPMIDNNDYVSDQALGYQSGFTAADICPNNPLQGQITLEKEASDYQEVKQTEVVSNDLLQIVSDLSDESYLLMITGVPVCSGPKQEIEELAFALYSGEHEMCDGNPVPIHDIIILKRVKVRVGLFLE